MIRYIIKWFLCCWMPVAALAGHGKQVYDFHLTQGMSGKVIMDFDQQKIVTDIEGKRTVMAAFSDEDEDELTDFRNVVSSMENVVFGDINFDGYTDIGVLMSIGYGGVNTFRDYYLYHPRKGQYIKGIHRASNLKISSQKYRLLTALMKSGPSYDRDMYRVGDKGEVLKILSEEGHWSEKKNGMIYAYTSKANVALQKVYFYTAPGIPKGKVYVIKNDRVAVEALSEHKGELWVKVAYKGKKKTYRGWVRWSDLRFGELKDQR